jgi:hypothetical protein
MDRFDTKLRRASALVGINLFVLLIFVAVFELSFGSWFVPYVLPNPKKFNGSFTFRQSMYQPAGLITYARDRYGLRGVQGPIETVKLVTVGGSTTDQALIGDGQTWQDVIREKTGINVANAGLDGMGTQSLTVVLDEWLHRIPGLHPKSYLYYIGVNDAPMSQTVELANQQRSYDWTRRIRARSAILQAIAGLRARFAKPILVNHAAVLPDGGEMKKIGPEIDPAVIAAFVEKMYKPNLRATLEDHRARGEQAIFVSQTANPALVAYRADGVYVSRPEIGTWAAALQQLDRAAEAVCKEYAPQCTFVDLANELKFVPDDFYDLVHNTPQGARKIGLFLSAKLVGLPAFSDAEKRR